MYTFVILALSWTEGSCRQQSSEGSGSWRLSCYRWEPFLFLFEWMCCHAPSCHYTTVQVVARNVSPQMPQNFTVVLSVNSLTQWDKFTIHSPMVHKVKAAACSWLGSWPDMPSVLLDTVDSSTMKNTVSSSVMAPNMSLDLPGPKDGDPCRFLQSAAFDLETGNW